MKEMKQETSGPEPRPATSAPAKKAERVQSSRYEWERKSVESEAPPISRTARGSLMTSLGAWLKKIFTSNRDFFDKDDDATPSPA